MPKMCKVQQLHSEQENRKYQNNMTKCVLLFSYFRLIFISVCIFAFKKTHIKNIILIGLDTNNWIVDYTW